MPQKISLAGRHTVFALFVLGSLLGAAGAQTEHVLYSFCAQKNCTDGLQPQTNLVLDQKGNLYGTTLAGGVYNRGCSGGEGCGVVFKLTPEGKETVLYSFCSRANCADGAVPSSGLIFDQKGNLYGTTSAGGSSSACTSSYGCGVVFKLTPKGKETVLYSFCALTNCADGEIPGGGLTFDKNGNLYGTTFLGGPNLTNGVVFKLTTEGQYSVLYSFCALTNCADGTYPAVFPPGVVFDQQGNLYGTTSGGGTHEKGVVFKLTPEGHETVLYSFYRDGWLPDAGVVFDGQGNLYGTTPSGTHCPAGLCGVAFKLTPQGQYSVLHKFFGTDGRFPEFGLILDRKGNLYGPAHSGGAHKAGVVFKLTPEGKETVLYSFCSQTNCADGEDPAAELTFDGKGNLYGVTTGGGSHRRGVVFKITP